MKSRLRIMIALFVSILLFSCSEGYDDRAINEAREVSTPTAPEQVVKTYEISTPEVSGVTVYVVESAWGRKYHKSEDCRGLRRATHPIVGVDSLEAVRRHYRACRICYR